MPKDRTVGVPTGYKVKLNVSERLNLSTLFPKEGNRIVMFLIEDIAEKTRLSKQEIALINYKTVETQTSKGPATHSTWNPEKIKEKQFEFTKTEIGFLQGRIEKLDKTEKITSSIWPLVKKLDAFKVSEEKN